MRIGQGFDAHRFGEGDHLVLGGVTIAHTHGLIAHSDGDVVLHAICDALLGAIGAGDIGRHFPDSDPAFKNADSRDLLRAVRAKLATAGYVVGNLDVTIIAQQPKIAPHVGAMRERIGADLAITDVTCINIKATTTEQMGFTGRGEGIAAMAVVLLAPAANQ